MKDQVKDIILVPKKGTKLYEVKLAGKLHHSYSGKPLTVKIKSKGLKKVHAICASKDLNSFSVDHL